ncbi:hypothetical protein D3C87_1983160 [compost metagenome]
MHERMERLKLVKLTGLIDFSLSGKETQLRFLGADLFLQAAALDSRIDRLT